MWVRTASSRDGQVRRQVLRGGTQVGELPAINEPYPFLPRVEIKRPPTVVGTNTVVNMQSGLYFGYLGLVDGILSRIKREVTGVKRVIATGGLATLFENDSEHIDETDDELTLKGLKIIWDRNRGARRR